MDLIIYRRIKNIFKINVWKLGERIISPLAFLKAPTKPLRNFPVNRVHVSIRLMYRN